jgi:hypothetical protein
MPRPVGNPLTWGFYTRRTLERLLRALGSQQHTLFYSMGIFGTVGVEEKELSCTYRQTLFSWALRVV